MEMDEEKALYFAQGVLKFWICDQHGLMKFYDHDGELGASRLAASFPRKI